MRERFQCEECHYKTTAKDVLEKHKSLNHKQNKTTAKKRINCAHCKKYFYLDKTFKEHMRQIHGEQIYPCEYCRQTFENNDMLRAHIESTHERDNINLLQRSVQQRRYQTDQQET